MTHKLGDSRYIVLSTLVSHNMRTKQDELEIRLFDLDSERGDADCIVDITAQTWSSNTRAAQTHELEKAQKILQSEFFHGQFKKEKKKA